MAVHPSLASEIRDEPDYPTMLKRSYPNGVLVGIVKGQVWCYRVVPLSPVMDVHTSDELHNAAAGVMSALEGLAGMSQNRMNNRGMSKGGYREFHMLLTSVPRLYRPAGHSPLYGMLTEHLGHRVVPKRQLLFGVRLEAETGITGTASPVDVVKRVVSAVTMEPRLEDYDADLARVSFVLSRAGFRVPTSDEVAMADSWWNLGRHNLTPYLPHPDHLHVFDSTKALQLAERIGYGNCDQWNQTNVPGLLDLTMATVSEAELEDITVTSEYALWMQDLLSKQARAVSVRGRLEPMKVTRGEIRKQIKKWDSDELEQRKNAKRTRAEQQDLMSETRALEGLYASKDTPATIIDTSVVVALDGHVTNLDGLTANSIIRLSSMEARQAAALTEMMLCSPSRQNPRLHQWPTHVVAYSGMAGLTTAGDDDEPRAVLGFTEADGQPVGLSPIASSRADAPPINIVSGYTGSGKTLLLQWLAAQFAEIPTPKGENTPVVVINPKSNSDLSKMVSWVQARTGQGQVYNLDNLLHADGVFDPIRFSRNPEVGLEMALNAILAINPFGPHKSAYELPLTTALRYGITAGATCIGQALEIAAANGAADPNMVKMVLQLADAIPKARAIIGRNPNGNALSVAGGLTLIQAGETSLSLDDTSEHVDMSARVDRTLLRLMVQGSAAALANRDGVVMFDEAWVFTKGAGSAMEALGRTAREMRVMMMMFNQRPSEMLGAGLENYISRSFTMSLPEKEARAACEIAKLEPTEERIGRLTDGSMGHVIGPDRTVYKGSRGIFVGLDERPVVVEVVIPKAFFAVASTNAAEKDAFTAAAPGR